ncbi:Organic cation/carnitine transporter like [Melia azedarach]|uniref:Organic cation/carnitine transporter like n=1 Tax=Melia azedarach TaxID=155640 RepID=A0ACC1YT20_MELAZ|nr:Organic cation/carnitine transporter like [Melia azedarach]
MRSTSASDPGDDKSLRSPLLPPSKQPATDEPEKLLIDDMLSKYCGEFGQWQLRHFVLTSLAWALEAFHTMVMIFADREPEWKCLGPGCDPSEKNICGFEPGSWTWTGGADRSTVAQWGLICEEKYKVGLVQALFFCGCMIGKFFQFLLRSVNLYY